MSSTHAFRSAPFRLVPCGVVLLLAALPVGAAELPDPSAAGLSPKQRLDALVERVKHEQSLVESMTADFVQKKSSPLLLEPETLPGTFSYQAPDQARWVYREPQPMVLVIQGEEMTLWHQTADLAERSSVGRISEQVFKYMGASGSLAELMKYFSVTAEFPEAEGDPYLLALQPKYPRIKKRLEAMQIWVDPATFLPSRLRYVEPSGGETDLEFSDLVTNVELAPGTFELDLPEHVEIKTISLGGN